MGMLYGEPVAQTLPEVTQSVFFCMERLPEMDEVGGQGDINDSIVDRTLAAADITLDRVQEMGRHRNINGWQCLERIAHQDIRGTAGRICTTHNPVL